MGDMKTPDFDDLLAAFDIPDATSLDPKEAIQSTSDEPENHLKPSGMCLDENLSLSQSVPAPDVPAVSVIVKNTSRQESFEGTEKEGNHMGSTFLQNGFRSPEVGTELHSSEQVYIKLEPSFINGDSSRGYDKHESLKAEPLPTFNQFSPISSPEPEDYSKDNGILNKQKAEASPYFPQASMYVPVDPCVVDPLRKPCETELSMFDEYCKKEQKSDCMEMERSAEEIRDADKSNSFLGVSLPFKEENSTDEEQVLSESPVGSSAVPPRQRIKPAHSKLSSCVAALVALQAKKVALVPKEEPLSVSVEAPVTLKESIKGSPKMPKSPKSPRSPLEVVKKISKPPDSPMSVCSDTSSKDSPSVSAGSPPAIPKVRIKTIKMSSGEIKRTVTRILPRVEPDDMVKSPEDFQGENSSGEDVKPLSLQDDVKPLAPWEDVKPLAPQEDVKPLAPREDVKPLVPREDVKPLVPREDVKPLVSLEDVKPLVPLEDVKPFAPWEEGKPLAPREEGKPLAPREEGKPLAPREEGKTLAPREEGKTLAPREEGRTLAPREDGGKPLALREDGKPLALREDGKPLALREDGKPLALREDGKPLAPRDDVKPLAPREDVKPLVPVEDGKPFAPRVGKPLAPPEDVTCSEKPRNPVKTLPPNVVSSQVTNAKNEKKKGATPSNPPNPTSGSAKTSSSSQNKKQSSATTTKAASNPTTQLPKAVHLANLNLVPNSVSVPVPVKPTPVKPIQPLTVPLVHQVKVAAPVIVEAFNKLLHSANPVPTYTPNLSPPPECNILLPSSGYTCLECGDSFALERSLTQHHNRRSVHIEVMCTQCCKTVQFYNKCSLLGHAREHKSKGLIMQCSQLMMKPISADQMLSASQTIAPVTIVQLSPATQRTIASVAQPSAWTGLAYAPAMPLYADPYGLIRHGFKCLECSRQVENYTCLAGHYQRVAEEKDGLTCQVCQMMLPNKCSYSAHQRTHTHKSPYCCPECGVLCRSAYFQTHVKENCLHYTRKVAFRCIHCGVVFMSLGMLKVHIQDKHCEVFHKCSFCPMAFKSAESTAAHITALHPTANHKNALIIYKCSCETVFNKKRLLHQHFYQNTNTLLVSVFKCPECLLAYMQKQLLVQHLKNVHGLPKAPEDTSSAPKKSDSAEKPADSATQAKAPSKSVGTAPSKSVGTAPRKDSESSESQQNLKLSGWTCGECSEWFMDRETYIFHMKKSHGKSMKRYPCRQCDRSFNSNASLRRHVRNNHDTKKDFTCCYCTERPTFPKPSLLANHILLMHGIKNPELSQVSKSAPVTPETPTQRGDKGQVTGTKRLISETREKPDAKKRKTLLNCAKCGFATDTSARFLAHIPRHKTDDSTYQCLHCGLCYTSQISLNRHLFIVHKVKEEEEEEEEEEDDDDDDDDEGYLRKVSHERKTSEAQNIKQERGESWECARCNLTFDLESAYDTHVRTHRDNSSSKREKVSH